MLSVHSFIRVLVGLALGLTTAPLASAQVIQPGDLGGATLEDLMKIRIVSAARKEQRVEEVPAAVFVLTQDDIRRSGMRTLPELFRLVPGVQVAQINSRNWAISIRGFNGQLSNKLLVLVDGRSVYNRVFSGVFWDAEDLILDDIERIEVIRGPGAAVWGANAVNGVINIVTKPAKATQGALVRVGAGTFDRAQATVRYGSTLGTAAYRVYSQFTARGETTFAALRPNDNWNAFTNGARIDWAQGPSEWTLDGSFRAGSGEAVWALPADGRPNLAPATRVTSSFRAATVLGRWTRRGERGSSLQVQSSIGLSRRTDLVSADENRIDTDVQYHVAPHGRHDIVLGGGYRFVNHSTGTSFSVAFDPRSVNTVVGHVFVQDEIALTRALHLTAGAKVEHDTFAGWGLQPTARLMWAPRVGHHVWLGASRALRTPALSDLHLTAVARVVAADPVPVEIVLLGNPNYKAERFHDLEAGYRVDVGATAALDVTTFRGRYSGLPTNEPLPPAFFLTPSPHLRLATRYANGLDANTTGLEVAARVLLTANWRVNASYTGFRLTARPQTFSMAAAPAAYDGNAPSHQWQLNTSVPLGGRGELHGGIFHTGRLRALQVPAHTRADMGVEVSLGPSVSLRAVGTNLLAATHAEFAGSPILASRIPRAVTVQLVWRPR